MGTPSFALEVQVPWSTKLLDGTKAIETRSYELRQDVVGQEILLVESRPGGLSVHGLDSGVAVGIVVFGSCKRYISYDEWAADSLKHGVDPNAPSDAFGWSDAAEKWGWVVSSIRTLRPPHQPVVLSKAHRLYRSIFSLQDLSLKGSSCDHLDT